MAFTGKYVLENQENCEEFFKALGITNLKDSSSDEIITGIYQNDDFRLTKFLLDKTWNNTFPIGKEAELGTVTQFPKYLYTAEVVGDKFVEVMSLITLKFYDKLQQMCRRLL
uniref:Uncharacterized protein n=1 Tax=Lates calcarifer TaxID=8187 RepID=A0A4W6E608_LATCA